MYICICVGVTESDIKGHIKDGLATMADLMYETGVALGCGMCRLDVERIIMHEKACKTAPQPLNLAIVKPF